METTSIRKGRFVVQEIKENSLEINIKTINRQNSLTNCRKFYIITNNNSSASTMELPSINIFAYEMKTKEWIKVDDILKKKLHYNDSSFYKIFKYFSDSSSNDSIDMNLNK